MLFRNSMKVRAQAVTGTTADLTTLAEWLGITADELEISGVNSLKEITVYTCIRIRAETLAKLPLKIYREQEGKRKQADHYLYPLLKLRPNPYMSPTDFWKCLETQRHIYGNAYAYLDVAGTGRIKGMYPLDSSRMRVYVDDMGLLSSKNSVWYVYTDNTGKQYKLRSDELLHFKGLSTNGLAGMSTIETLRIGIENAKASSTFLNNSYKNGMQTAGIIQFVGDLSQAAKKTFVEKFEEMSSGLDNANRVSMLPLGYQYQPTALKLTDAQFLENAKLTIQQLTAAFGVKLHQVNYLEKSSYASTAEANREFYIDTLMADLKMYEDELGYKIFTDREITQGYYPKFNADVIMRGDAKTRYEAYAQAIQNGFKTPNEVRALEEDEPLPGGDKLLVNGNMVSIEEAGAAYRKGGDS